MKRIITVISAAALLAGTLLFSGCKEEYTSYSDAEYVMFADTLSTHMVTAEQEYFTIPVASTVVRDYDRTFGVEVIDKGSNAIESRHYRLLSNTVTIKAGELQTDVRVHGIYDNIENTDSLGFTLRLIAPEQVEWDLYRDNLQTKVVMMKGCPYSLDDFTGWCVVTSVFLLNYPGVNGSSYQRLIYTEKHPTEEHTIIMHDWLFDGYDITMRFDPSDPEHPLVTMDKDQVLSDEESVFGQIHGDNHILVTHSPYYDNYFNACQHFVALWIQATVSKLGSTTGVVNNGLVGHFYNIMEWVSDEEADRLKREEGM